LQFYRKINSRTTLCLCIYILFTTEACLHTTDVLYFFAALLNEKEKENEGNVSICCEEDITDR